jgi:glycosyltransferase involved in cell wall biosynthesis
VTLVINGRFLRSASPTGMHRVSSALVDGLLARGVDAELLAPPGVDDPRVDRTVWAPRGRLADHLWEQVSLPVAARRRPILSLLNTAPVVTRRAATMVHDLGFRILEWHATGHRAYGATVMASARRAAVVVTPSHAMAAELADAGLDARRIHVVRPAVDARWHPRDAVAVEAVRARFGLRRPYCLMVGWHHPRKGAATVVAAHAQLVEEQPHDLVLVGTGSATFAPVQLPDLPSIRVLGYVADEELAALMSGAAACVYPSLYEGFGLPVVEALACGAPTIASDLPVLHEATLDAAHFVAQGDVLGWARAMRAAFAGEIRPGPAPDWSWDDATGQLLDALAPLL